MHKTENCKDLHNYDGTQIREHFGGTRLHWTTSFEILTSTFLPTHDDRLVFSSVVGVSSVARLWSCRLVAIGPSPGALLKIRREREIALRLSLFIENMKTYQKNKEWNCNKLTGFYLFRSSIVIPAGPRILISRKTIQLNRWSHNWSYTLWSNYRAQWGSHLKLLSIVKNTLGRNDILVFRWIWSEQEQ